jgi:RsiW-degrading membrane proteinase PrsW (M82 family)
MGILITSVTAAGNVILIWFPPGITAVEQLIGVLAVSAATAGSLILIWFLDRFEKDPLWLLTAVFLWGAVPAITAAYILNSLFHLPLYYMLGREAEIILGAFFVAPPVEETAKGIALVIVFFALRHRFTDVLAGITFEPGLRGPRTFPKFARRSTEAAWRR